MGEAKRRKLAEVKDGAAQERPSGITFKYGLITNQVLQGALRKLADFVDWKDSKDLYRFAKFKSHFDREEKKAALWYKKLIDKHSEKEPLQKMSKITNKLEQAFDAKGKPLTKPKYKPNARGQMSIAMVDQDAFDKDIRVFDNHVFTVEVLQFSCDDLLKAGITPAELIPCARLVHDLPEELASDDMDDEILREELHDELEEDESPDTLDVEGDGDLGEEDEAAQEEPDGDGGSGDQPTQ